MTALQEEWGKFIWELHDLMTNTPGDEPRIKDCTMLEEWRMACGYNPFDSEMDHDLWKETYDVLDDENEMDFYRRIAKRCGLEDGTMKLKYPRVAAAMKIP